MATGIISYGTYIPYWRLQSDAVRNALGAGRHSTTRAVAGYDQDATTMAVEAARGALMRGPVESVGALTLSSSTPTYKSKTNATAVHAALSLADGVRAADANGPERAGAGALHAGFETASAHLVVLSDAGTGPSGSADEMGLGDAAAAFVLGQDASRPPIAELIGRSSVSQEFLDRWSAPGEPFAQSWEERFGQDIYTAIGEQSVQRALADAGITASEVAAAAITGLSPRSVSAVAKSSGLSKALADDLTKQIGRTGSAHLGILLADLLDRAEPGDVLVVSLLADGADTFVFRVTDAIVSLRRRETVAEQISAGNDGLSYADFLTWKGLLSRQGPRRPEPARSAAPPARRSVEWKFGFTGSRCDSCGTRHLPPQRVCLRCGTTDQMKAEKLADVRGTIATYTVDHLAYSLAPPTIGVVIDFDGGGRFACELTDASPDEVAVGNRVEMSFRKINESGGVANYFWKARPLEDETA